MNTVGPAEMPTSILSVTGTIQTPIRWIALSLWFKSEAEAVIGRGRSVTAGLGIEAAMTASPELPDREYPTAAARLRRIL
jgi:hypothetical protein